MPAASSSPSLVLDAVDALDLPAKPLGVVESITLLQALSGVPDPRKARGRRHSLQSILFLAVGAVLAGARSYAAIAQWSQRATGPVMVCRASPHATTFGRVLAAVDAAALQQTLTGWVLDRCQARRRAALADVRARRDGRVVVAFDGKTRRGARDGTGGQAKLVGVFDHAFGLVLTQAEVAAGDELAAFVPALNALPDLRNVLITADALHCQRTHADYLHAAAPTTCSPSKATNPPSAPRWPGCPGRRRRDSGTDTSDTAGPSPARSRSSTWTQRRRPGCFPTGHEPSRSSDGGAARAGGNRPSRRSTRSPLWTTATPARDCWPAGSAGTGR